MAQTTHVRRRATRSWRWVILSVLLAAALALAAAGQARAARTVVSLTFDDATADQMPAASILASHSMRGTLYVPSGRVGSEDYYMTWQQVQDFASSGVGNEIAGHTVNHVDLTTLSTSQQIAEVCDDRQALIGQGFTPVSFAYPHAEANASAEQVVRDCGYSSGRDVGGVGCSGCDAAETIPPQNPFLLRTPRAAISSTSVSTFQGFVTNAENNGGGWLIFVFHNICNGCNENGWSAAKLTQLLDWLQPRAANGTVVQTVGEVMEGGYARPKAATPLLAPLVPAYQPCASPNRTHSAPLSFDSCNPPARYTSELTVGTIDANGQPAKSVSSLKLATVNGNIQTPVDEADLRIEASLTDIRNTSDHSDYTGELEARIPIRITNGSNTPAAGGPGPGTTVDFPYTFTIPCAATVDNTVGSDCTLTTTADTLVLNTITEGRRSIWRTGPIEVYDGGPDGLASTVEGNNLFQTQGVFVP